MPLFDFRCPECGSVREVILIKHDVPVTCHMHGEGRLVTMERLPSAPAFKVNGHNAANGYNGGQTHEMTKVEKAKIGVADTTRVTVKS